MRSTVLVVILLLSSTRARAEEVRLELSMAGAVKTAIERSPEFVILHQDLSRAAALIDLEKGAYHPSFIADVRGTYLDDPGGTTTFPELRKSVLGTLGLQGTLIIGLEYLIAIELLYEQVDTAFSGFDRGQTLRFRLELRQPLLRGGWLGPNEAPIVIRTIEQTGTRARSYARAAALLAQVEILYWRLVLARQELSVQNDALRLSNRQVEDSKAQLRLGHVASIQVLEAEAAVSRRESAIEVSVANIASAEAELLALILPADKFDVEVTIIPTEQPPVDPLNTTASEDLAIAYRERQELVAARAEVGAAAAALEQARDSLLPALDLVAGALVTGFSGREADDPVAQVDPDLVGGFGDVFANTQNPTAFVGLRLELPVTNDQAEAREELAVAEQRRWQAREEALRMQIYSEVFAARRTLLADLRRVESAKVLVARSEALLTGQRQSFKAGAAVSFDVVRATVGVTRARIELLRSLVRARISHSRLLLAKGQYLSAHNIELSLGER